MARKKKKQSQGVYYLILFICAVCLAYEPVAKILSDARQKSSTPAKIELTAGTRLEIPAKLKNVSEQILQRKGYTVSYNKVTTDDYKGAGMDRGHMCPAGDNRWHWKAMQESFYMTNICPQNHNLNRGDWKELEESCRRWAQEEGKIYIVCGPILYDQRHRTIGKKHKITVPEAFFKVVLCADSNPPKAIGFIYKNASGNHPLDSYVNTVDEVERITGIDFFPALPDEIEEKVEAEYDLKLW